MVMLRLRNEIVSSCNGNWWNSKLMKWWFDEMASWWSGKFNKMEQGWNQLDKMAHIDEKTIDKTATWKNGNFTQQQVDKIACW